MTKKKSATAMLADAWQRKGSTISFSRERRATLKAFADLHGGLSPAEAIYLLIDGVKPETPINTNAHSTESTQATTLSSTISLELQDLREQLNQMNDKADENNETALRCAESLEQIANAMEPLQALITKLAPPKSQAARLNSSQWMRVALKAMGGSSGSTLRAELRPIANSSPSNAETTEFAVNALGLDSGPMRLARDVFPTLIIEGASAKVTLDQRAQSNVKTVFRLIIGQEEQGRRRARIFVIENGAVASSPILDWLIDTSS